MKKVSRVLMNFDNVRLEEKTVEIKYGGKFYRVSISVNPRSNNVIATIFVDRKKVIDSAVCIVNQSIFFGYAGIDLGVGIDFFFECDKESNKGNPVDYRDLGSRAFLCIVEEVV